MAGFKSVAMVDYLCRSGVLSPSRKRAPGRGRARLYSWDDIVYLRVLNKLLSRGLPVRGLKNALSAAKKYQGRFDRGQKPSKYLITDGTKVWFETTNQGLVDLMDGQLEFAFIIDMHRVHDEVRAAEQRHKKSRRVGKNG